MLSRFRGGVWNGALVEVPLGADHKPRRRLVVTITDPDDPDHPIHDYPYVYGLGGLSAQEATYEPLTSA
jgi:hypothetical protein